MKFFVLSYHLKRYNSKKKWVNVINFSVGKWKSSDHLLLVNTNALEKSGTKNVLFSTSIHRNDRLLIASFLFFIIKKTSQAPTLVLLSSLFIFFLRSFQKTCLRCLAIMMTSNSFYDAYILYNKNSIMIKVKYKQVNMFSIHKKYILYK